jgi:predicted metal-dependent enzyme (double-stranded beta helix superfamily)
MALTHTPVSPVLASLIESIREVVKSGDDDGEVARRVAKLLEPCLGGDSFLTEAQREPDPDHYRQHVLHVEEDGSFSIVALVWLPGQETPIHDHVSWCVVGVHEGQEYETHYQLRSNEAGERWLVEDDQSVNPPGSTAALTPPGDIHKVVNNGQTLAISLHIYGADIGKLGSSIRRRYDLPVHTV